MIISLCAGSYRSSVPLTPSCVSTVPAVRLGLGLHLHGDLSGIHQEGLVLALLPDHHRDVGDHRAGDEASVDLPVLGTVGGTEMYELKIKTFMAGLIYIGNPYKL